MAGKSENVAIFNPLVLPLPNWHPDGPDGEIDGFVIPFVYPAGGRQPENRGARIRVVREEDGNWIAVKVDCPTTAATAAQARAFAGAWIRAAEILDNVTKPKPKPADDGVVDCEVVDDDEDQDDELDDPRTTEWTHSTGNEVR